MAGVAWWRAGGHIGGTTNAALGQALPRQGGEGDGEPVPGGPRWLGGDAAREEAPRVAAGQHRRQGRRDPGRGHPLRRRGTHVVGGEEVGCDRLERRRRRVPHHLGRREPVRRERVGGQQAATLPRQRRHGAQHAGGAVGGAAAAQSRQGVRRRAEQAAGDHREPARRAAQIGLEGRHGRDRVVSSSASASRASARASRSAASSCPVADRRVPAARRPRAGGAACRAAASSTASRHHCSRISASIGVRAASRARASSWLKAIRANSASRRSGGANRAQRKRSGSWRRTNAASDRAGAASIPAASWRNLSAMRPIWRRLAAPQAAPRASTRAFLDAGGGRRLALTQAAGSRAPRARSIIGRRHMAFSLPPLPYSANALAGQGMCQETLELHHGKHHNAYVTALNGLVESKDLGRQVARGHRRRGRQAGRRRAAGAEPGRAALEPLPVLAGDVAQGRRREAAAARSRPRSTRTSAASRSSRRPSSRPA